MSQDRTYRAAYRTTGDGMGLALIVLVMLVTAALLLFSSGCPVVHGAGA